MKTYKRLSILAAGAALAVLATAASAQNMVDTGASPWVAPSADVTVHRSEDAAKASGGSDTRALSNDKGQSKADKQGAIEPSGAAMLVERGT